MQAAGKWRWTRRRFEDAVNESSCDSGVGEGSVRFHFVGLGSEDMGVDEELTRTVIYLKLRGAWRRDRGNREGGRSLRERVSSRGLVVRCLEAFPEGGEPRGEVQRRPTKEGS